MAHDRYLYMTYSSPDKEETIEAKDLSKVSATSNGCLVKLSNFSSYLKKNNDLMSNRLEDAEDEKNHGFEL